MSATRVMLLLVCLGLFGCMPFRNYPLPVSPGEARETFAPIATAASNLGYRAYQRPERVWVDVDATTALVYGFDASGNYTLYVMLRDKHPPGGLDAAFAAGKARADELWAHAMALRVPTAPPPVVVAPPQPTFQLNISR
jgi:hypothetical protein